MAAFEIQARLKDEIYKPTAVFYLTIAATEADAVVAVQAVLANGWVTAEVREVPVETAERAGVNTGTPVVALSVP